MSAFDGEFRRIATTINNSEFRIIFAFCVTGLMLTFSNTAAELFEYLP